MRSNRIAANVRARPKAQILITTAPFSERMRQAVQSTDGPDRSMLLEQHGRDPDSIRNALLIQIPPRPRYSSLVAYARFRRASASTSPEGDPVSRFPYPWKLMS
jgi:hypothetical protein